MHYWNVLKRRRVIEMKDKIEITITTTVEVPLGEYCDKCDNLKRRSIKIGWGAGLGSPGTHTIYECAPFNCQLIYDTVDDPSTRTGFRGVIMKCQPCLSATTHQAYKDD